MRRALIALAGLGVALSAAAEAQQVRKVRPNAAVGPTPVYVSAVIIDVLDIDDVDESFVVDIAALVMWKDERLAWRADGVSAKHIYGVDEVWTPRLVVVNEKDVTRDLEALVEVDPEGNARILQRFRGRFSTVLDLEDFPADTQHLPIRFAAVGYSTKEVQIVVDEERMGMLDNAALSGWELELGSWELNSIRVDHDTSLAGVTFHVTAHREVSYFLWTMMLPLVLIILMAWTVFWIDPNFLPSQVGVSTASVFSLMAYRTALRLGLPKVSYMTKADVFILGATLLVFGALAHAIGTGRLAGTGPGVS